MYEPDAYAVRLGQRLRGARRLANYTQAYVAQRLGVAVPTLSRYETGHVRFPQHLVDEFAKILGKPLEQLMPAKVGSTLGADESLGATATKMASILHKIDDPEMRGAVLQRLNDLVVSHLQERATGAERFDEWPPTTKPGTSRQMPPWPLSQDNQNHEALAAELRLEMVRSDGDLRLNYQPIVDAVTGALLGFEALLRWRNRAGAEVPPSEIFAIAARAGLVEALDFWVIQEACSDTAAWIRLRPDLIISVNVSDGVLGSPNCVDVLRGALKACGTAPHNICIEVLEELIMDGPTTDNLLALRDLGLRLAIDDFGTGRSNLARLLELKVDAVKLDRSFFAGRPSDGNDIEFLKSVVRMSQQRGSVVIAEGVASGFDAELAQLIGCNAIQGFWVSEVLNVEAARRLVIRGRLSRR